MPVSCRMSPVEARIVAFLLKAFSSQPPGPALERIEASWLSGFERARLRDVPGRFLQSSGQAGMAGTKPAQAVKSVNAGRVAVAPTEMKRVVAYRLDSHSLQACRNGSRLDFWLGGELVDAEGAGTFLSEIPGRIGTEMAVIPGNLGALGADSLYQRGHEVRQWTPSLQRQCGRFPGQLNGSTRASCTTVIVPSPAGLHESCSLFPADTDITPPRERIGENRGISTREHGLTRCAGGRCRACLFISHQALEREIGCEGTGNVGNLARDALEVDRLPPRLTRNGGRRFRVLPIQEVPGRHPAGDPYPRRQKTIG